MWYRVSQAVFATYLNVSKTSVASWESGGKRPGPTAVKLLNLYEGQRPIIWRE
jgi:putative transcriptional regulator